MSEPKPARSNYHADPECARYWKSEVFRRANAKIVALVGEMGGWEQLPEKFKVSGDSWEEIESRITQASNDGKWWDVIDIGDDYLRRVDTFCDNWRKQMEKKRNAGAPQKAESEAA